MCMVQNKWRKVALFHNPNEHQTVDFRSVEILMEVLETSRRFGLSVSGMYCDSDVFSEIEGVSFLVNHIRVSSKISVWHGES